MEYPGFRMSVRVLRLGLLLLAGCALVLPLESANRESDVETILGRAAGLILAEVISSERVDGRPTDGCLGDIVHLSVLRGTGEQPRSLSLTQSCACMIGPCQEKPPPPFVPTPGLRLWLALASKHDWAANPHGILGTWPPDHPDARLLEEAVETDALKLRPRFHPEAGVSYGYELSDDGWSIHVLDGDRKLWTRWMPGKKVERSASWSVNTADAQELRSPDILPSEYVLWAETLRTLGPDNPFEVPEGPYYVRETLDARTGDLLVTHVSKVQRGQFEVAAQVFARGSGRLVLHRRQDVLLEGGLKLGASRERWLRRIVKRFDPDTGDLLSEEVYRQDGEWLPVDPALASAGAIESPTPPEPRPLQAVELYDVEFSGPLHALNQPPATTERAHPRHAPSAVLRGRPTVEPSACSLANRPLVFRGGSGYQQVQFLLPHGFRRYHVEVQLCAELHASTSAMSALFDIPASHSINLLSGGRIAHHYAGARDETPHLVDVRSEAELQHPIRIRFELDTDEHRLRAWVNDQPAFQVTQMTGYVNRPPLSLRLNLVGAAGELGAADDIRITGFR